MSKFMLMHSGGFPFPYIANFISGMGALRGDGWTVTGGQAVNTPAEGAELLTNGNMEAGNPPTGWSATNSATLTGQADERTGGAGAQSIRIARNGTNFPGAQQQFAASSAWHWMKIRAYHKLGTATKSTFTSTNGFAGIIHYFPETSWTQKTIGSIAVSASNKILTFGAQTSTDGQYAGWDDASCVPLTKLTAGMRCPATLPVVKATVNVPLGESAGVWMCGDGTDPANYMGLVVHRYQDSSTQRGHLYLYNVVAGVATKVYGATVAYASDAPHVVEIRRTAAATCQVWYDNAQVGVDQTIVAQVQSYQYAGLIATGGGCAVDAFSLAEFVAKSGVYLGTSITAGNVAVGSEYVGLTSAWLRWQEPLYSFVSLANLGVGGSTSYYGLARVASVVAGYSPDVILLEYAVNDTFTDFYARSGEALIRRIRTLLPNTRIVFLAFTRVTNPAVNDAANLNQDLHDRWGAMCAAYGVVFVSFADALEELVDEGATLATYLNDTVHPSVTGHQLAHELVRQTLLSAYSGGSMPALPARIYDCADFESIPVLRNGTANDGETGSWSTSGVARTSSAVGSTITFNFSGVSFGFVKLAASTGTVGITVDGGSETIIDLSTHGVAIDWDMVLANTSHSVVFRVASGSVSVETFIAI